MKKNIIWPKNIYKNYFLIFFLLFVVSSGFVLFFILKPIPLENPVPAVESAIVDDFSGNLYFNNEFGTTIFSEKLIDNINQAKTSVDIAVYSMDSQEIRNALYRAANRGVEVVVIFSDRRKDGHDALLFEAPENFKRIDIESENGLLHHKFMIVDYGQEGQKLWFGSYNFTYLQEKFDPSFLFETDRLEIISVFHSEFKRIEGGQHGILKKSTVNPYAALFHYPQGDLEIWFSPEDGNGLHTRLLGLINSSQEDIKLIIWNFTKSSLANALASASRRVPVLIITDDFNYSLEDSVFTDLQIQKKRRHLDNLQIITDYKRNIEVASKFKLHDFNSFLHHHFIIVDNKIVAFGSGNWSSNGFYRNDEGAIVSNIPQIVNAFVDTWDLQYDFNK